MVLLYHYSNCERSELSSKNRINGVPVTDETGKLVGILCQSDFIAQQKNLPIPSFFTFIDSFIPTTSMKQIEKQIKKITAATVDQAMTKNPVTVHPDTRIEEVATLMVDKNFYTISVMAAKLTNKIEFIGFLSVHLCNHRDIRLYVHVRQDIPSAYLDIKCVPLDLVCSLIE